MSTSHSQLCSNYESEKFTDKKPKENINGASLGIKFEETIEFQESVKETLIRTIRDGDLESANLLIDMLDDVNTPAKNSGTPLHAAVAYGRHEIVKILIDKGAQVDVIMSESKNRGLTPLHLAAMWNQVKCAKILLENGANVTQQSDSVCHPIHLSVFQGHVEMAALLLDYGTDVNILLNNNFFKMLTTAKEVQLDHTMPLLHCSIIRRHNNMTQLLLHRGADINLASTVGRTTLMRAVSVNNPELVEYLLNEGVDVNARDSYGQPVLHYTMINSNRRKSHYSKEEDKFKLEKLKIVKLLVEFGADVNAHFPADKKHTSIIHYMIGYGFSMGVDYLLFKSELNYEEIDVRTVTSGQLIQKWVTPDIANDRNYLIDLQTNFVKIIFYLITWAFGRQMIDLPINKGIILESPIHQWVPQEKYTQGVTRCKNWITGGLNHLKQTKVGDSNVTWWHLLTCRMNELVKLMSNKRVNYMVELKRSKNSILRNYHFMLKKRLEIAKKRHRLLAISTEAVFSSFCNYLPYDCCEKIVHYLNNEELMCITVFYDIKVDSSMF